MYCTKKITEDLVWVGANDRRLAMFEGVYSVPQGVSYNSYLLKDETNVLFDTVDKAVAGTFFENLEHELQGKKLDYVVIQHLEPDHSYSFRELLLRYPDVTVVCNKKSQDMIKQFFNIDIEDRTYVVSEGSILNTGKHELTFVMAPMVHWPEVMVTYDKADKILFSADAFGTFGALNGAIFADEVDFFSDYMKEARRYYTNIVGKYGAQVQSLLKKASTLEINMICPLHGFVWRSRIGDYIDKYNKWSSYTPEVTGVMIAYASVYGNTENAAEILSSRLREKGIKTVMFDVSVTPASEIVSASFEYSHLVFASTTYNAGIFVSMEEVLHDIIAHNIQNRTVAFIENGSWAATSGKLMKELFKDSKNITFISETVSIKSALKPEQLRDMEILADKIAQTIIVPKDEVKAETSLIEPSAMFKLSYGLYVLTAKDGDKDNGCIINTTTQVTDNPKTIVVAVNKNNYTCDMILKTGKFNVSVLSESVPFEVFKHFGFQSGRDVNKFENFADAKRSENGIYYIDKNVNAFMSAEVIENKDCGTHILFYAQVTEAKVLSDEKSVTYQFYFDHIKPKPMVTEKRKGYVCKICGYIYEGEPLPDDFICPLCKHGAEDFEPLSE